MAKRYDTVCRATLTTHDLMRHYTRDSHDPNCRVLAECNFGCRTFSPSSSPVAFSGCHAAIVIGRLLLWMAMAIYATSEHSMGRQWRRLT